MSNAPTLKAVVRRVQAWVISQPRHKRHIARRAGIAPNTLGRVEAPDWCPSTETLQRLERLIPPGWPHREPVPAPARGANDHA